MFKENTKQVNRMMTRLFAAGSGAIVVLVLCSWLGIFEFGKSYTLIVLVAGLAVSIGPSICIRFLPDYVMKYYMLIVLALFIGILGTSNHIGVYITYALVPIFSCLYFEPGLVIRSSTFSYVVMLVSLYVNTAGKFEVTLLGRSRLGIFIAYALGFTIEYVLVVVFLYTVVKRAKKMMEERYSAQEQNRMKSEFLSNMSHEIRTPMNAIMGMADVALRKEMSDDLRRCLTVIESSSSGLLEIINDILDFSKIEAGKLKIIQEPYETRMLKEDMIAIVEARNIERKVPIYYHIQEDMPPVLRGDVVRLRQVMLNYASNAIKYTETGRIDITMSCEPAENGMVQMVYCVTDTGQGIREEDMDQLFTMYGQVDVEKNYGKEGSGIGLAISKYFIEHMGGSVQVESHYGKGSTFSFSVPQEIIDQPVKQQKKKEQFSFTAPDARVLVVDDNAINREVAEELLKPLQLSVEQANSGEKAIEKVKSSRYDLILMDSHMPGMSGGEATRAIRTYEQGCGRKTPIVAMTADAITGVRERLLADGMDDYISKPIDVELLFTIMRRYLPEEKVREMQTGKRKKLGCG